MHESTGRRALDGRHARAAGGGRGGVEARERGQRLQARLHHLAVRAAQAPAQRRQQRGQLPACARPAAQPPRLGADRVHAAACCAAQPQARAPRAPQRARPMPCRPMPCRRAPGRAGLKIGLGLGVGYVRLYEGRG